MFKGFAGHKGLAWVFAAVLIVLVFVLGFTGYRYAYGENVSVQTTDGWQKVFNSNQSGFYIDMERMLDAGDDGRILTIINDSANFKLMDGYVTGNDHVLDAIVYVGQRNVNGDAIGSATFAQPFTVVYQEVGYDNDGDALDLVVQCYELKLYENEFYATTQQEGTLYNSQNTGLVVYSLGGKDSEPPEFRSSDFRSDAKGKFGDWDRDGTRWEWAHVYNNTNCYLVPAGTVTNANGSGNITSMLNSACIKDVTWCTKFDDIDQPARAATGYNKTTAELYAMTGAESIAAHNGTVKRAYVDANTVIVQETTSRDNSDLSFHGSTATGPREAYSSWLGGVVFVSEGAAKQNLSWRGSNCGTVLGVGPMGYNGSGSYQLTGTKVLNGRDLCEGEFTFELVDANTDTVISTAKNDADGNFKFTVSLGSDDFPKILNLKVREKSGGLPSVSYDTHDETLHGSVKATGESSSELYVDWDDESEAKKIVFTNRYVPDSCTWTPTVRKALNGRDLRSGEFSFELRDESGTVLQTKKNDENGDVIFDILTFDEVGTYRYTVTEVEGNDATVDYSDFVYKLRLDVEDTGLGYLKVTGTNESVPETRTFRNEVVSWEVYAVKHSDEAYASVVSANPEAYSVEGAVFELRNSAGSVVGQQSSDANGKTPAFVIEEPGTYTLSEVEPPAGHVLTTETATFTIGKGSPTKQTFDFTNPALTHGLAVSKQDVETMASPQGGAPDFANARFQVEYFAGDTVSDTPAAKAVWKTDGDGLMNIASASPVSGSWPYKVANENVLPLGTIRVTEVAAPEGYLVNPLQMIGHVIEQSGSASVVWE